MTTRIASAPGKLVLLGEYAVLHGAPSLVLAVNRRATATLASSDTGDWEIDSPTLRLRARVRVGERGASIDDSAAPQLGWVAMLLDGFAPAAHLPACRVELASDVFHTTRAGAREKLGLGSSAALTVALLGALHAAAGLAAPTLDGAIAAHRASERGGSGIDVAASLHGGLQRFRLEAGVAHATPLALPDALHWCCMYSGRPASTRAMLAKVAAWRGRDPQAFARHLQELATISSRGIDAVAANDAAAFLSCLHAYANALARFGQSAGADIASRGHRELAGIAAECGCVYKSCGAGGGDVGITFAVDDSRIRKFAGSASRAGFTVIEMEADPQGLVVASNR